MRIVGDHIILRIVDNSDLNFLLKWENAPEIQEFNAVNEKLTAEDIQKFIDGIHDVYLEKQLRLMIVLKDSDMPIGTLDIFDYDSKHNSLGVGIIIFDPEQRAKGFASKAMDMFLRYASKYLDVKSVYCNIHPENNVSINFFKSKGFVKFSPNIKSQFSEKKLKDMNLYIFDIR